MRIKISTEQFQLLHEALKDEIPDYMQKIVQKRYGDKFLDMDVPEHSPIIPEITKEVVDEELGEEIYKRIVKNFHSKIHEQWKKTELFQIYGYNPETMPHPMESSVEAIDSLFKRILLFEMALNGGKPVSQNDSSSIDLKKFYSNNFTLLQSKNNNIKNPIFSKNKSNLYNFLISAKRAFPSLFYDVDPIKVINDKHFMGLRNPIVNAEETLRKIREGKLYLHISSKPYDILRMSVSDFYDSCQNIYTGGEYGTEFNRQLLSNVFDKNSKVAFLIFDAPFIDKMGNKHKNSPVARMIIRTTPEGAILFDRVYPSEMNEKMRKIVTDLTGLQNTGKPGDLYHYTNIEGLPAPYMDTYRIGTNMKANSKNTRANILADHLGINVNVIYQYSNSYFSAPGQGNYEFYDVWTNWEADEMLRDKIDYKELYDYTLKQVFLDFKLIEIEEFKSLFYDEKIRFLRDTTEFEGKSSEEINARINKLKELQKYTKNNREDKELTDEIQRLLKGFAENLMKKADYDDNGYLEYWNKQYGVSTIKQLYDYCNKNNKHIWRDVWNKFIYNIDSEKFIKVAYGNKIRAMNILLTDTGSIEEIMVGNDIWYIHKTNDEGV